MKPSSRALLQSTLWLSLSACGSSHPGTDEADAALPRDDAAPAPDALALADAAPPPLDAGVALDAFDLPDAFEMPDAFAEPLDAAMEDTRYCWAVDDANVLCRG
jgi:hypothetical protein